MYTTVTSSPRQDELLFWPAFVTRKMSPRSRKSGYGLLLGCRSGLDGGREKKTFFSCFSSSKNHEIKTSDGRARHRNRSGVVDLVGREPLIIARVENGVTKFSPKRRRKRQIFQKKNWIRKTVSVGNFHFLAAGKLTLGGRDITSKPASQ